MADKLAGKKILVTRPQQQSGSLCRMIENHGGVAIRFPVIGIRPPSDPDSLRQILARVADYDIGIFISQNAVNYTMELLNKETHALYNLRLIALGKATARSLKQAGFTEVSYMESVASSETLLELPALQESLVKGTRVIIFRGVGGREFLADALTERGARVDYAEVYQRVPVQYEDETLVRIWQQERPDYIVVTSNEGLQYLVDMLSSEQKAVLFDTQLVVLGSRMSQLAGMLGFRKTPVMAEETSDRGLLQALMHAAGITE